MQRPNNLLFAKVSLKVRRIEKTNNRQVKYLTSLKRRLLRRVEKKRKFYLKGDQRRGADQYRTQKSVTKPSSERPKFVCKGKTIINKIQNQKSAHATAIERFLKKPAGRNVQYNNKARRQTRVGKRQRKWLEPSYRKKQSNPKIT